MRALLLISLLTSAVWAQDADRIFHFTNVSNAQGLQEMATALRVVGNIRQISLDVPSNTITLSGTPEQIAVCAWVVQHLDQPARMRSPGLQNQGATFGANVYLVYYLKNATIPIGQQEIITTLRTVLDVQKIYMSTRPGALVLTGPASSMAMAEWLIQQLDMPASNPPLSTRAYTSPDEPDNPVRVLYMPLSATKQTLQEVVTAVRITGQVMKVYSCFDSRAIVMRDTAARIAAAQALVAGWSMP